ncbi:MAG: ArsC/Spx/MgsR family protein [Flavobacteriales bacterium]
MKYNNILLHNPSCRKFSEAIDFLKSKKIQFELVLYISNKLNRDEIKDIVSKTSLSPIDLIRTQEKIWKELYKNKSLSNNSLIDAMFEYPNLIKRPIFISNSKAIIAIPPGKFLNIF